LTATVGGDNRDSAMRSIHDLADMASLKRCFWVAPAVGLLVAMAFSPTTRAQLLNPFPGYSGPLLNDQDRRLARDALQTLLNADQVTVGKTEVWSNPADGRHGSLTMVGSFHHNSMPCRTVQASASFPERPNPRNFTIRLCHTPAGQWKML
jgi:surface antigen